MTSKHKQQESAQEIHHPFPVTNKDYPAPLTPRLPNNTLSIGTGPSPGQGSFELRVKTHLDVKDYLTFYFQTYDASGEVGPRWYLNYGVTATTEEIHLLVASQVFDTAIGGKLEIHYEVKGTGTSAIHTVKVVTDKPQQ